MTSTAHEDDEAEPASAVPDDPRASPGGPDEGLAPIEQSPGSAGADDEAGEPGAEDTDDEPKGDRAGQEDDGAGQEDHGPGQEDDGPGQDAGEPGEPIDDPAQTALEPRPRRDLSERTSQAVVRVNDPGTALPVLARATAGAWLRAAAWGAGTTLRLGTALARAATDPAVASQAYSELTEGVRNYAREFLGINELDRDVRLLGSLGNSGSRDGAVSEASLRAQGEELLRAAAEVGFDQRAHPAYARILTELSPDEARILRLLALDGPQPLVDIRAANLIGLGSQLIAPSLNMLAAQSGAQMRDRTPIYLTNLDRLGLIVLSSDELDDPIVYQVLEAQPDVLSTIKATQRARIIRRSVVLTPFGQDFCQVCLPLHSPALNPGRG